MVVNIEQSIVIIIEQSLEITIQSLCDHGCEEAKGAQRADTLLAVAD